MMVHKSNPIPNWEQISLHKQYLLDELRNTTYQNAIKKVVRPDSVVIDVGSGTGLLGFFAVQSGCRKLYSIEMSNLIEHAKETARRNGFLKQIEFIHSDIYQVRLSERADIIIHEQIGDFVWDEGMIEKLSFARRNLLKENGLILPNKIRVTLVPICHPSTFIDKSFWKKDKYGIDFSNLLEVELSQARLTMGARKISLKDETSYMGKPVLVTETNLYTDVTRPDELHAEFEIERRGVCTGILGFFDVHFDKENAFSTRPAELNSNWGQFILPITDQKLCLEGDRIQVTVNLAKIHSDWSWSIKILEQSPLRSL